MSFFETCDYAEGVKLLNEAGSRALWALTTKHYNTKGLSFQVFEKLYFNTVVPVTDYASEIWGYKKYDFLDRLQFRAARTVLGVGKRAPLPYLAGDTCLLDVQSRHHTYMIRLWTRIISMSRKRIPKKFIYGTEKAPRKIVGRQK
jgi:hypothetical protein